MSHILARAKLCFYSPLNIGCSLSPLTKTTIQAAYRPNVRKLHVTGHTSKPTPSAAKAVSPAEVYR